MPKRAAGVPAQPAFIKKLRQAPVPGGVRARDSDQCPTLAPPIVNDKRPATPSIQYMEKFAANFVSSTPLFLTLTSMTSPYDPTSKRPRRPCDVYIKRTAVQQYVLAQITMRLTQPGNEDARIPHAGRGVFKWSCGTSSARRFSSAQASSLQQYMSMARLEKRRNQHEIASVVDHAAVLTKGRVLQSKPSIAMFSYTQPTATPAVVLFMQPNWRVLERRMVDTLRGSEYRRTPDHDTLPKRRVKDILKTFIQEHTVTKQECTRVANNRAKVVCSRGKSVWTTQIKTTVTYKPAAPGMRYCTFCHTLLPVDQFIREKDLRFMCAACLSNASRTSKLQRYDTLPYEYDAEFLRLNLYDDMQRTFRGKCKFVLSVKDSRRICKQYKLSVFIWSYLPRDPRQTVDASNIVIVLKKSRPAVLRAWTATNNPAIYMSAAAAAEKRDNYHDTMRERKDKNGRVMAPHAGFYTPEQRLVKMRKTKHRRVQAQ